MPEVRLPEVLRSVLRHLNKSLCLEKVSSTFGAGEATKCSILFSCLDKQSSLTTPIPNALQRVCITFCLLGFFFFHCITDHVHSSQALRSLGSYFSSHSTLFVAYLSSQITFRLSPLISPWQTLTPLHSLYCQTNLFKLFHVLSFMPVRISP